MKWYTGMTHPVIFLSLRWVVRLILVLKYIWTENEILQPFLGYGKDEMWLTAIATTTKVPEIFMLLPCAILNALHVCINSFHPCQIIYSCVLIFRGEKRPR